MLKNLSVVNYALIDRLEIEFNAGTNIITGETGAGKSVILGALSLILGQRAELSTLSDNKKKCIIEGSFDISSYGYESFFQEKELDYDNIVLLRREINPNGKSRAFINDTPVNLELLKEFGEKIVDIHSQHNTLTLQDSNFQLDFVDAFAQHKPLLEEYKIVLKEYKSLKSLIADLINIHEKSKAEQDYFQYQYNELESAQLNENEQTELESERDLLLHAGEVNSVISSIVLVLEKGDNPLVSALREIENSMQKVAKFFPAIIDLKDRLQSASIELKDISSELEHTIQNIHNNPVRLEKIEARLDLIYNLQQKHRVNTLADLIRIKEVFKEKISEVFLLDDRIREQEAKLNLTHEKLVECADMLSFNRKNVKSKIEKGIKDVLKKIAMPEAAIEIGITNTDDFTLKGKDKINFLFTANKGSELKPISKVASGGEMSRLMLAIKSIITQKNVLPTIIFDEIDSGVSGDIAAKVGEIMKRMSDNMQVVIITHLPQIARIGECHFLVHKEITNTNTFTRIKKLSKEERVFEIARMLSGDIVSDEALDNAKVLINQQK